MNSCLQVYFKVYFDVRVNQSIHDAPYHILTLLKADKTQPKEGVSSSDALRQDRRVVRPF